MSKKDKKWKRQEGKEIKEKGIETSMSGRKIDVGGAGYQNKLLLSNLTDGSF